MFRFRATATGLVAGVIVAASLTLSACGSQARRTVLNTERIERAIEHSSLAQRGVLTQVSCPSGVDQTKGLVFSCVAMTGATSTRFVVSELDGSGHVHYAAR